MDDEILVYNNTTTPLYGSTNYFKHASWYYPGQLYPDVDLYISKEEYLRKDLSVYLVNKNLNRNKVIIDAELKRQCEENNVNYRKNLSYYINSLQQDVFSKHIVIVTGCRYIPLHERYSSVNINYYEELKKREVFYSSLNRNISESLPPKKN